MRKIFQREWHGVAFDSFAPLSSRYLADSEFYRRFYSRFFESHHGWKDLEPEWIRYKLQVADVVRKRIRGGRTLGVACGLGVIEKALWEAGVHSLDVTEVAEEPLRWLRAECPRIRVFIGRFPDCLPKEEKYDLIYISTLDYIFDRSELISFLRGVAVRLTREGSCLMLAPTLLGEGNSFARMNHAVLDSLLFLREALGIRGRGQFFGYQRTRGEFRDAMAAAGFTEIEDGLEERTTRWDNYWIEGRMTR